MQEKIDKLLAQVEKLTNGKEFKAMKARAEKAEETNADLLASRKSIRGQIYGTKSQKSRKNDKDRNDDTTRSTTPLPNGSCDPYRGSGKTHSSMAAARWRG